ncbi:MAG TPA: hypothetical protein EYP55_07625, partial [Anaerolineae bacterium]|nr:hypothetical protein [Anaerolineae bacterium]
MPLAVKGEKPGLHGIAKGIMVFPRRKGLRMVISAAIIILCFLFLGYRLYRNWALLTSYSWEIHFIPLILSFVVYTLELSLATLGWSSITARLAGLSDLHKNLKIYWAANLGKLLPGTVWYIAGRVYLYEQEGVAKAVTAMNSLLELVLLVLAGAVVSLSFLPLLSTPQWLKNPLVLVAIVPLGLLLVHPWTIGGLWRRVGRAEMPESLRWRDTLTWLAIYAGVWMGGGLVLYWAINAFYTLPLTYLPQVIGVWALSELTTYISLVSPSGLGIREVALSVLLGYYVPVPIAVVVALAVRIGL